MKDSRVYCLAYKRGFAHALGGRRYQGGPSPHNRMEVCLPGSIFLGAAQAGYRDGWLEGKASMYV